MLSASVLLKVALLNIIGTSVIASVIEVPVSQNVSAGQTVELACAAASSADIITWSPGNIRSTTTNIESLSGGGKRSLLTFTASVVNNNTMIKCLVTDHNTNISTINSAYLLVQGRLSAVGMLNSTEVDQCTLNVTWTAPYTLQGVSINYYTINITRHSDGKLLKTSTVTDTRYTYLPNILGELLIISVVAVNDAGTGNVSQINMMSPSSITKLMLIGILKETSRKQQKNHTTWIYTYSMQENTTCSNAIGNITVQACLNSSSCEEAQVTGNMTILSANMLERFVVVNFTSLMENRKFSSKLQVGYIGEVHELQQSLPIDISTFDVRNISLDGQQIMNGRVCFNVGFVTGHETPAEAFIQLNSNTSDDISKTIDESSNCVQNLQSNTTYDIRAIDADAADQINSTAAVTISGVFVPYYAPPTSAETTFIVTATNSPNATTTSTGTLIIVISVVAVVVGGLAVVAVIVVIVVVVVRRRNRNRRPPVEAVEMKYLNQNDPQADEDGQRDHNEGGQDGRQDHNEGGQDGRQDHNEGGLDGRQDHNEGGLDGRQDHNDGGQDGRQDHNEGGQDHNEGGQDGRQDQNEGGQDGRQDHDDGGQDGQRDHNKGTQDQNECYDQDQNHGRQIDDEANEDSESNRNSRSHSLENSRDDLISLNGSQSAGNLRRNCDTNSQFFIIDIPNESTEESKEEKEKEEEEEEEKEELKERGGNYCTVS